MLAVYMTMIDSEEDKATFKMLYEQYLNLMLHTAYQILGNQEDAEDAVSEAFIRIAKNFSKFNGEVCPKTANQFVIIVRNIAIDIYRKNKKKDEISFVDDIEVKNSNDNVSEELEFALSLLSRPEKDILYLYYIYGCTVKEISKLFAISQAAAYKRIQRAKSHLKEILEESKYEQV